MKRKILFALVCLGGTLLSGAITTANAQTYCTPVYTTGCSTGAQIDSVILNGDYNTSIDNGTGCSSNGYGDYTSSITAPDLTQGQTYTLRIVTSKPSAFSHNDARAWIDYNDDGTFSDATADSEVIGSQNSANTFTFTFTVPTFVTSGNYRLRIRIRNGLVIVASTIPPCSSVNAGEAEDYLVHIGDTSSCPAPTNLSAANISADSVLLSWGGNASTYRIQYGITGFTLGTGTQVTSTSDSFELTGLLPNTSYSFYVRSICTPGSDSSAWSSADTFRTLCDTPHVSGISFTSGSNCTFSFTALNPQNVVNYDWDFGDGSPHSSQPGPVAHTFTTSGNHTVTLIVSNECGSDTLSISVNCNNLGIHQTQLTKNQLQLYPNPAKDLVTLENTSPYPIKSVIVYNILGQIIYQGKINNNAQSYQLDTHSYAPGVYDLKVLMSDGNWVSRKFEIRK